LGFAELPSVFGKATLGTLKLTAKAPENRWLEDNFPFGKAYYQGRAVSFGEGRV